MEVVWLGGRNVGCFWLLLVVVGCCWLLLVVVGCCWLLLVIVDLAVKSLKSFPQNINSGHFKGEVTHESLIIHEIPTVYSAFVVIHPHP